MLSKFTQNAAYHFFLLTLAYRRFRGEKPRKYIIVTCAATYVVKVQSLRNNSSVKKYIFCPQITIRMYVLYCAFVLVFVAVAEQASLGPVCNNVTIVHSNDGAKKVKLVIIDYD